MHRSSSAMAFLLWNLALVLPPTACSPAAPPASDLGALSMPSVVTARDGATTAQIGGRTLWTFGDTLMSAVGADGWQYRSATAGWGTGTTLGLEEALDAKGTPFQLIPYTESEIAYNRSGGPQERYALWPTSVLTDVDESALIVFQELKVHPGELNYENVGVGLSHLRVGQTQASRDANLLFAAPERAWSLGGIRDAGFTYLYACDPVSGVLDQECRVVRAPSEAVASQSSWQAWDGTAWNSDRSRAAIVFHGAPGDVSISRNAHTDGFLAVYSGIFSNDVFFRTAARPQGPWSDAQRLFTAQAPTDGRTCYSAKEHPELSTDDGKTIVVSYARSLGGFRGEVRLARASLP